MRWRLSESKPRLSLVCAVRRWARSEWACWVSKDLGLLPKTFESHTAIPEKCPVSARPVLSAELILNVAVAMHDVKDHDIFSLDAINDDVLSHREAPQTCA